jgi:uncharacterized protein (TIRG00374 family)
MAAGPDSAAVSRQSAGDRIERAIEDRTDPGAIQDRAIAEPRRGGIRRTGFWVGVTGVSLYLVAPSLLEVLGSYRQLDEIGLAWVPALLALEFLSLACLWALQRIALPSAPISAIIDSQLAANGLSKIAPGGGAVGAALQYKMLVRRGLQGPTVAAALTAVNVATFAVVLALPVLALPSFLAGAVDPDLTNAALVSLGVFTLLTGFGAVLMSSDPILGSVARLLQRVRNFIRRGSPPLTGLPPRLRRERDRVKATLGTRWKLALVATAGRWAFDYGILLGALAAVGAFPRPGLVLLAFCAAQLLAQIPVTPGGLGFVEAGLTATLALAGVGAADAVLATFTYRLFTYWVPLPVGLVAFGLHQRHAAGG